MYLMLLAIILLILYIFLDKKTSNKKDKTESNRGKSFDYSNGYQRKWLFSYNEKDAFKVIEKVAKENGCTALAKVRLLDLIEPKENDKKHKDYLWKIQAKHVDFVICNEKLVAKWVIELLDSSHKEESRRERDKFVRDSLTKCGYKYLETYKVTEELIKNLIEEKS